MTTSCESPRQILERVARRAMVARGFEPDFPRDALAQLDRIDHAATSAAGAAARDLRARLWCSIDNDDSRDLDQLTVAEALADGTTRISIAVAEVDALVAKGTPIDRHAHVNTTSVYTPARVYPMLPEKLSTDLTSLNPEVDRLAMVVEMVVDGEGTVLSSEIYRALVRNQAKLAYNAVAAWLDGKGEAPAGLAAVKGLEDNLRLQDRVATLLRGFRHEQGALDLETIEMRTVFEGDEVKDLRPDEKNRAKLIIEDFMIAANGVVARFLQAKRFPSVRRVVRSPDRWERIVDLAEGHGASLPDHPDARALGAFLKKQREADPVRFPDLSLAVIKLMGRGEYVAEFPGQDVTGHFGLAVADYAHSTAPNRRYPDLITQRLVKAALAGDQPPYGREELLALVAHCTDQEDDAKKIERLTKKAAAACVLSSQIGREFDGIVTGASSKGTWVRIFAPPVEGKVEEGAEGLDVGDRVRVKLVHTDVERGFIDFVRIGASRIGRRRGGR